MVKTSIGIQTVNEWASGPAAMNMSDGNGGLIPNSRDATIQPGQTAVFLGTGAGPVSFDETVGAPMQDLDLDLRVYVGGQEAQIGYKGRAPGKAGIDEFDVMIPEGLGRLPYVCSVIFVTGGMVSNFSSIAVGDGGPCGQPANPLPSEGFLKSGAIELVRSVTRLPANCRSARRFRTSLADIGVAAFSSIDFSKVVQTAQTPANIVGPCIVDTLPSPPQANPPSSQRLSELPGRRHGL